MNTILKIATDKLGVAQQRFASTRQLCSEITRKISQTQQESGYDPGLQPVLDALALMEKPISQDDYVSLVCREKEVRRDASVALEKAIQQSLSAPFDLQSQVHMAEYEITELLEKRSSLEEDIQACHTRLEKSFETFSKSKSDNSSGAFGIIGGSLILGFLFWLASVILLTVGVSFSWVKKHDVTDAAKLLLSQPLEILYLLPYLALLFPVMGLVFAVVDNIRSCREDKKEVNQKRAEVDREIDQQTRENQDELIEVEAELRKHQACVDQWPKLSESIPKVRSTLEKALEQLTQLGGVAAKLSGTHSFYRAPHLH